MAKYLNLPNGTSVEVPDEMSYGEAMAKAQQQFPEAFAPKEKPRTGLGAALSKGLEGLVSSGQTSYEALTGSPEEAARRGLQRGAKMAEKYPEQVSLEKVKQAYEKSGLLSAAGEALGQVPAALAEQAPNIGATIAGAQAGQRLGGMFGAPGRLIGAGVGAAAPGLAQMFGSNIERQAAEQQKEGKPIEISRGAAAAAAVPQAALDVAGTFIPLGGRLVSKLTGVPEKALVGRTAEQAQKLADERLYTTLAKGLGVGVMAEVPTEVAQQMLERAQAGLSLTSPDALKEYGETAYQVSLLAPLGGAGRVVERAGARADIVQKQQAEMADQRAQEAIDAETAAVAEKERKAQPDYALSVEQQYNDLIAKRDEIDARIKAPITKGDLAAEQVRNEAKREKKELLGSDETKSLISEYNQLKSSGAFTQIEADRAAKQAEEKATEQQRLASELQRLGTQKQQQADTDRRQALLQGQIEGEPEVDLLEAARTRKPFKAPKPTADIQGLVDFLLADPVRAQEALANRTQFPGLTKQQNEAVLGAVELELQQDRDIEAKKAEQRAGMLGTQMAGQANADLLGAARDRGPGAVPEIVGLQRIGEKNRPTETEQGAPSVRKGTVTGEGTQGKLISERLKSAQDMLAEGEEETMSPEDEAMVDNLIKTLPLGDRIIAPGQVQRGEGYSNYAERSNLLTMLKFARETRNRPEAGRIIQELRKLEAPSEVTGTGEATRVGAENLNEVLGAANMTEARAAEAAAERHINDQNTAMLGYVRFLESMRRGTLVLPQSAQNRLDALRNEYLESHLAELDERRAAFGMPPMADWERGEARARVMEGFNKIEADWGKKETTFDNVLAVQKDIRKNIYDNLTNAAKRFQTEQQNQIAEKTTTGTGRRVAAPDELKLRERKQAESTEDIITRLLDTAGQRQRAVPTAAVKPAQKVGSLADIGKLMEPEKAAGELQPFSAKMVDTLERIQNWLPQTSDAEFKGMARDLVQQIEAGNEPNQFDLRDLNEKIRGFEEAGLSAARPGATPEELQRTSAQQQGTLFPEAEVAVGRATPANFQRMLDSKNIQGLRQAIADQKQANIDVLQDLQKTIPSAQNLLAKAEIKTVKARAKVKTLGERAKEDQTDEEIKKAWADAAREVIAAETALQSIPRRMAYLIEIRDSLAKLNKTDRQTLIALIDEALKFATDPATPAALRDSLEVKEFTELKQSLDPEKINAEIKRLDNLYKAAKKAVEPARAKLQAALDKYDQEGLIRESLEREHQKALDALKKAEAAEREAKNAVREQEQENKTVEEDAKETDRKYKEALLRAQSGMGLPGIRVEDDMTAMRKKVQGLRGAMGSLEDQVSAEKDPVRKQELQEKYLAKQQELEQLTPPKQVTELRTPEAEQTAKEAEDRAAAQQAGIDARRRARTGEAAPKLPTRVQGQVARLGTTQRITQTGTKRDKDNVRRAEQILNVVTKSRADLKELQDRMQFLRDTGKAKVSNRYTPLFKKLETREEQLKNRLARAEKAQTKVQTEQKQTAEALASSQRQAKPYKKDVVYRPVSEEGPGMQTAAVKRLLARLTEGWENVPPIEVVDSFDGLPEAIKEQARADGVAGQIPGLYDPETNKVYLVADRLHTGEDVVATVAHEVTGHFGLRSMLGRDYTAKMDDIYNGNAAVRARADAKLAEMPSLTQQTATEEVLAEMAEQPPTEDTRSALRKIFDAIKDWFKLFTGETVSDAAVQQIVANARSHVIEGGESRIGEVSGKALYRSPAPTYANPTLARAGAVASKTIAKQRGVMDAIKEEGAGLKLMTQFVDRFAPLEKLSKYMEGHKGLQMMYYARMYDQRMNFVSQSVGNGALRRVEKTRPDGKKEYLIESTPGASLKGVVNILKRGNDLVGSAEGNSQLFSMYLIAKRAERVGLSKLNYGGQVTEADLDDVRRAVAGTPGLKAVYDAAQSEYNSYNRDMLQFAVDSGALSAKTREELIKAGDYVPYYRERNGAVEMMLGNSTIARIGNTKEQPYLKELTGGETPILDFMTSAVQNTNMLTDMSLRNLSTKNAVYELQALGMAKVGKGNAASGPNVVKYKEDGEDKFALLDTEDVVINGKRYPTGIPADLVVKGMEGIPVQNTIITKLMGGPARALRKFVVLNPLYAARQLFRDSLAAPMLSGADFAPIFGALNEVGSTTGKTLTQRGVTGGQVFTGTQEDLTMILRNMAANKSGWAEGLAKLEAMSMEADALTRRAQYNSYIKQGLSEMEATYMALESMNFGKRGMNPAMHTLSTVIPFFNAQLQSLNVLFKAFSGNMPFNEKLKIREKLYERGLMLASMTMAYAALMQDDEAYKNATPEQKYGNWFIYVPGVDEPVRVPIPFEIGYIFKAIPEAIVNMMMNERGGEEAAKAFKQIALQIVPGGTSYGMPQAMKPLLEVGLGKSFYTGRDLESAHEQSLEPGFRSRDNTTALARMIGEQFNISPIKLDALISGYFSTTGLALADALSFALPGPDVEAPTKRASEMRLVGGLFQPKDAGGIINATYDRLKEAKQVTDTYKDLVAKGRTADAQRYLQENLQQFAESGLESKFSSYMQKIAKAEQAVRGSKDLSADEKRERLDRLREFKINFANDVRAAAGRTAPQ